jgi:zinc protease
MNMNHCRLLPLLALLVIASSCVSTQQVSGHPDPRAGTAASTRVAPAVPVRRVVALSTSDPIINIRVAFEAGSADDPAGKEGLTRLTAALMKEATADLDAAALSDALFPLAAELSVQVDKSATVFIARVHKDHEARFLQLLSDVLTRPRFDVDDFNRLRDEQLAYLQTTLRTGNDEALQREALEVALYDRAAVYEHGAASSHPYRHTPAGTVKGLSAITLADVVAHKDAVFAVDRCVLGVSGGASPGFVDALAAVVQSLPAQSVPRAAITTPVRPAKNALVIVDKPSAGTAISLGFVLPTLNRSHPDYAAMKLAETWFGEHRNLIGHLFHSMREVRGLNYGDYAYVEHFVEEPGSTFERTNIPRQSQYFSMWIRPVEHKNRLFALKMAAWELQRFVDVGIDSDDSFKRVQDFMMGYWPSKEAEPMRALGYAMDQTLTGLPLDRAQLRDAVKKLTRADVNAAIRRHLVANGLSFVVVTDGAAALQQQLLKHEVAGIAVEGADVQVQKDNAVIGAFDLGLDSASIVLVPPAAFFER